MRMLLIRLVLELLLGIAGIDTPVDVEAIACLPEAFELIEVLL